MAYRCCETTFETERDFKKHIRSKYWHRINHSDSLNLRIRNDVLYNILRNPKLLFGISNVIVPIQDKAIVYLPLSKDKTGLVLKRSIVGKLEGPKLNIDLIEYKFTSDKLIYNFGFKVRKINEENSQLVILSSMMVNIGILGRLLPSAVIKELQKMVTPQVFVDKYLSKNISSLSI
ncbi:hypothetical protein SULI_13695 [Saccharolobus solfataricus]|uniref:Uncharacterized protein n=3 Tax=Saccharolobus solfataricus TaxID=2287 RepID=Q97X79_SACS2|nr:hypothetical protein [Saccharolobus solfataricus]AAK42063.1 Hypothetical protein SSO1875 [Saccharolobus solfataricus P2]AKA74768.1 hypothetical protein SULB_2689 [Saccharolobus solfataricus]AKA77464.1 hypothetical protein SULC_2686 [Saccharolobus solfataricus]AKA80154.1 hypothetical protein SULA_2688 [Saccharolobus solfataricus]AZF69234.1 hypothetical protein SULG_13695 [Saccharolobus solfataricus]